MKIEHNMDEMEYVVEVEYEYETYSEMEFDEDYMSAKQYFYEEILKMKEGLK